MKDIVKGVVIWLITLIVVVLLVYIITKPEPSVSCDRLTLRFAKSVIGSYKDFSYAISFFLAAFFGWISFRKAEASSLKGTDPNKHLYWLFPIGYVVTFAILFLVYFSATKTGWFSLDISYCKQWKEWSDVLVRVKSVFGKIGLNNFYIAHFLDLIISYTFGFAFSVFASKFISEKTK